MNFKTYFGSAQNIPFDTLLQKLRHWYKEPMRLTWEE